MAGKALRSSFFNRDTRTVAQELIGAFLVRRIEEREVAVMVTETEAYDGPEDRASHAWRGKTGRNEPMFGPPGIWYVYLCYGVHEMLNVVTREQGYPAAVLIRGVLMPDGTRLEGPGKVTRQLMINRAFNTHLASVAAGLWFEKGNTNPGRIRAMPRVGVSYAGPLWAAKKWRYRLEPGEKILTK